jgi:hypothetical protein
MGIGQNCFAVRKRSPGFFVWPSGITTKQRGLFEARPLLVSKFKDRKLSHLHVSDEIEEVGNN